MCELPCVVPLLAQAKLNIPPGSWIIVDTKREGTIEGQVYENPKFVTDSQTVFSIQLINAVKVASGQSIPGHLTLYENEISKITLKGSEDLTPDQSAKLKNHRRLVETVMGTFVITTMDQLNHLYRQLIKLEIQEVGCYFEFANDKTVEWVILNINNTIVPIQISKINSFGAENSDHLWISLGHHIFSNPNIQKIVLDCTDIVKYLYHSHGIKLQNVFDILIADTFVRSKNEEGNSRSKSILEEKETNNANSKLSNILVKYLDYMVHPREIQLINEMSQQPNNNSSKGSSSDNSISSFFIDDDPEEELVLYKLDILCSQQLHDEASTMKVLENFEQTKLKLKEVVVSEKKTSILKFRAIKVKYLLFLKLVLEKRMLESLDSLITNQMDFIIKSNNATSFGFLSSPRIIGHYFKTLLENTMAPE